MPIVGHFLQHEIPLPTRGEWAVHFVPRHGRYELETTFKMHAAHHTYVARCRNVVEKLILGHLGADFSAYVVWHLCHAVCNGRAPTGTSMAPEDTRVSIPDRRVFVST